MASTAGVGLVCEYCENIQTNKGANVGMCDEHYNYSLSYCEVCKSAEEEMCRHKLSSY